MKVELGGGRCAAPGWTVVDVNPAYADVVADISGPLPIGDGEVTDLRAIDVLEHISYRWTADALREWARICARGAGVFVQVPDAELIMRWFVDDDDRLCRRDTGPCSPLEGAEWRLLGGHQDGRYVDEGGDWRWNAHYSLWSSRKLWEALDGAGFRVEHIQTNAHPNILATCRRT